MVKLYAIMIIEDEIKNREMGTYESIIALNEKQTFMLTAAAQHEKWDVIVLPIYDCLYSSHSLSNHLLMCIILQHKMHAHLRKARIRESIIFLFCQKFGIPLSKIFTSSKQ